MFIDGADILLKKITHQLLREPDRFMLEPALDAGLPVLGLVEDNDEELAGASGTRLFVTNAAHRQKLKSTGERIVLNP